MSILKSLQTYLTQYDGMELRPINQVLTDSVDAVGECALAPTGNSITRTDILGNKAFSNNYVFYAKESAAHEVDRADNYDFLEDFSEWIDEQNDAEHFPELPGSYKITEIVPANGMLFDIQEDGTGLYQLQIKVTIGRRKIDG